MKKIHKILIYIGIIALVATGGYQVNKVLVQRPVIAESMNQFDEGNELLANKSYLMAYTAFKQVDPIDKERFALAQDKITESGKLYVDYLLEGAKDFASKQKYGDSLSYMDSLLAFDPNNETAKTLKVQYAAEKVAAAKIMADAEKVRLAAQAVEDAKAKAIVEAEKKAKAAEEKARAKTEGVKIGMTSEQVLGSNWGKPQKINRSTGSYGVHEQWVYGGNNYLYLEDGILTSIQN